MIYDRCFNPKIVTIGGTPAASNVVTLTFKDAKLSPTTQQISYTVQAGNTPTVIATALKNAINNNSNLKSHGFAATSSGAVITIVSATGNSLHDTYAVTVTGSVTATLSAGLNVGLTKTAAHESGHAFDFSWAKDHGGNPASQSKGFKALAGGSTTEIELLAKGFASSFLSCFARSDGIFTVVFYETNRYISNNDTVQQERNVWFSIFHCVLNSLCVWR